MRLCVYVCVCVRVCGRESHMDVSSLISVPSLQMKMKKDIDTIIAEERADIISKYDKVSVHWQLA